MATIDSFFSQLGDKIGEQVWFQQIKQKWEELDPQSRTYLRYVGLGGGAILALGLVIYGGVTVRSLRQELNEKSDLLQMIQTANEEMRRLKESGAAPQTAGAGDQAAQPWQPYFEQTAGSAGIDRGALAVQPEKPAPGTDVARESIIEIGLKKVGVKQVARFAYFLENGSRPVKLRNLTLDTHGDPSGTMDAQITVSAFTLKQ